MTIRTLLLTYKVCGYMCDCEKIHFLNLFHHTQMNAYVCEDACVTYRIFCLFCNVAYHCVLLLCLLYITQPNNHAFNFCI